jgi:hypothetical protein
MSADPYFARGVETKTSAQHKAALERCITRLREQIPIIGLRNPKIGDAKNQWIYCTQAWSPLGPGDRRQAAFANGRMIADTMQNLALLHWAYRETGITDYREGPAVSFPRVVPILGQAPEGAVEDRPVQLF